MSNGETWAFTGGRSFADQTMFDNALDQLTERFGCPDKIVHGAANGLDTMAAKWADRMAIPSIGIVADWNTHGRAAGPMRNEYILLDYKPRRLIAFPGGRGTADMVKRANHAEIEVIEVTLMGDFTGENMIESNAGWEVEGFIARLLRRTEENDERLVLEACSHLRALKHLLGKFLDAWNVHKEPSAHDIDEAWSICYGDRPKSTLDEPTTQD